MKDARIESLFHGVLNKMSFYLHKRTNRNQTKSNNKQIFQINIKQKKQQPERIDKN